MSLDRASADERRENPGTMEMAGGSPSYGTWMPTKFIYGPAILGIIFLGLSFLRTPFAIIALFFFALVGYAAYARYSLSSRGGDVQGRIWDLVLKRLDWDGEGRLLDIGCGNGPLTIRAAKKYPRAHLAGIDYWGKNWEYSQADCERNAQVEGVAERVEFQKASASTLPFKDGSFDAAVSNLVFHEVLDRKDKREVVREALRVVKKGGAFAFQDLFLEKRIYGEVEDLLDTIRSWGIESVTLDRTNEADFIPNALKLPFMVGKIAVIYGKK